MGNGSPNFQAIRYADALLMNIEASHKASNSVNVLNIKNQVRNCAHNHSLCDNILPNASTVPTGLLPDAALTDQGQMHDAIRRRRHGALALEFQQFFDVMRYNQTYTQRVLANRPNFNYARNRFHPIPQSERDTNKGL